MASISFNFIDHSNERSSVVFQLPEVTAVNFDEILGNVANQGRFELEQALLGVTRGTLYRVRANALDDTLSIVPPVDPDAQREDGLRVWAVGETTARLYSCTIPTADRATLAQPGSDEVPLTQTEMAALVTAIEENIQPAVSPGVFENVTVTRAALIGRSN